MAVIELAGIPICSDCFEEVADSFFEATEKLIDECNPSARNLRPENASQPGNN